MMYRLPLFAAAFLAVPGLIDAAVVRSPELAAVVVGSESDRYRWQNGEPFAEGSYDPQREAYTLTGNGQGIYWCHDAGGFAYVNDRPLCGAFTFTARIRSMQLPAVGVSQVGIMVKGRLGTMEPVLSLRWDTYWEGSKGTGLTWFNRITPTREMLSMDSAPSEKSCHGSGQGCLGRGLENTISGFANRDDLWLRVTRSLATGKSVYTLHARYGGGAWQEFPSRAGTNNACGSDPLVFVPNMELPNFMVPEDNGGLVYVGLCVANSSYGGQRVTAQFDSITLETDDPVATGQPPDRTFPPNAIWWPSFLGPNGNYTTSDDGLALVDILRDAALVWKSDYTPPGKSQAGRYGNNCGNLPTGGGASPIVVNDRVYMYYYEPVAGGPPKTPYPANCPCHTKEEWDLLFAPTSRDIVHCLDAVTGKTIWKKALDSGPYVEYSKGIISNHTPCYHNGRIYAAGCNRALYCLDAVTGERIWTSSTHDQPWTSALIVADSTLVIGIGGGRNAGRSVDVAGYSLETGRELWRCAGCTGGGATPSPWKHQGKENIVVANNEGRIRCLSPRTGQALWTLDGQGANNYTLRLSENYLVARPDSTHLAGYRIAPTGATRLWSIAGDLETGMIQGDVLYVTGNGLPDAASYAAVDMATGTVKGTLKPVQSTMGGGNMSNQLVATTGAGGYSFAAGQRVILNQLEGHTPMQIVMLRSLPDSFGFTDLSPWTPPNPQTCTYSENRVGIAIPYVNGRLFVRGYDGIYCYDLRKRAGCGVSAVAGVPAAYGAGTPTTRSRGAGDVMARWWQRQGVTLCDVRGRTTPEAAIGSPGVYLVPPGAADTGRRLLVVR